MYILLTTKSVYTPGDQRSRDFPGHGYPESTEYFSVATTYADSERSKFIARIEMLEHRNETYTAYEVTPTDSKENDHAGNWWCVNQLGNKMNIKSLLLEAPDGHLDPAVLAVIKTWDEPQTALNVLEALDTAVYCGGASEFAMQALARLLAIALQTENTTYEAVVRQATWRNKG